MSTTQADVPGTQSHLLAPIMLTAPAEGLALEFCVIARATGGTPPATSAPEGQKPAVRAILHLRIVDPGRRTARARSYVNMYESPASSPRQGAEQFEEVRELAQPGQSRPVVDSMLSQWPFGAGGVVNEDLVCLVSSAFSAAAEQALGMSWGSVLGAVQVDCLVREGTDAGRRLAMLLSRESSRFGGGPAEEWPIEMPEKVSCDSAGEGAAVGICTVCHDDLGKQEAVARTPCGHVYHRVCISQWLTRSHACPVCQYEMPKKAGHLATHL